jgi:hypothetical protein
VGSARGHQAVTLRCRFFVVFPAYPVKRIRFQEPGRLIFPVIPAPWIKFWGPSENAGVERSWSTEFVPAAPCHKLARLGSTRTTQAVAMPMRLLKSIDAFLTDHVGGLVARWFMGSFVGHLPEPQPCAPAGATSAGQTQPGGGDFSDTPQYMNNPTSPFSSYMWDDFPDISGSEPGSGDFGDPMQDMNNPASPFYMWHNFPHNINWPHFGGVDFRNSMQDVNNPASPFHTWNSCHDINDLGGFNVHSIHNEW